MDNVKVKITTVQTIDEAGNEDIIELVTEATLEYIDNCFIINYDESDITECKGSRTRLKIYKNKMIMTKVGTYSSRMEFEEKKAAVICILLHMEHLIWILLQLFTIIHLMNLAEAKYMLNTKLFLAMQEKIIIK